MNFRVTSALDGWLLRSGHHERAYGGIGVMACLLLGALAIGWPVMANHGFPLDDSWIYQVLGRNAARFGVPGFLPGRATSGSSSTIWPWIIAANYRLLPGVSPELYLLAVNVVFFCVIGAVLLRLAARDRLNVRETLVVAALPLATGNFAWLLSSGMEHLMFIATAFLAALLWLPAPAAGSGGQPQPKAWWAGVLLGLSVLARPEAVIFVPAFLALGWYLGRTRRELLRFLLPCVACALLMAGNNLATSHALLPVTAGGRRWMFLGQIQDGHLALAVRLLGIWAYQIVDFFYGLQFPKGSLLYKLLVLVTCAAICSGVVRLYRRHAWQILFLLLLAAMDFIVYCALLPAPGQGMRYQAMTLVFIFPLLTLGLLEWLQWLSVRCRRPWLAAPMGTAAVAGMFALALGSLHAWSGITDVGIKHINGTEIRMADWLNEHLPPSTPVASFDIGAIGYFGHVRVVDLGGLIDPHFLPFLSAGKAADYLRQRQVDWLVLSAGQELRTAEMQSNGHAVAFCDGMTSRLNLCDGPRLQKAYVVSFLTPKEEWDRSFRPTLNADQAQVLYRVEWR